MMLFIFALLLACRHQAMGLNMHQQPGFGTMGDLIAVLDGSRFNESDPNKVLQACQDLAKQVHDDSPMSVKAWEVIAQAAHKYIEDPAVSTICVDQFKNARDNNELAKLVDKTSALNALMDVAKKHSHRRNVQIVVPMAIGSVMLHASPQAFEKFQSLGGLGVIYDALFNFKDDYAVVNNAWGSLAYITHQGPEGARMVADWGGNLKGIKELVDQLREHKEAHFFEDPQKHTGPKFEILAILDGMFTMDVTGAYINESLKDGFIEQLVYAMQTDVDRRQLQHLACSNIVQMTTHVPSVETPLINNGILERIKTVLETMNFVDETPFDDSTVNAAFPVMESCATAIKNLGTTSNEHKMAIRRLELPKMVAMIIPDLNTEVVQHALESMCMGNMCV